MLTNGQITKMAREALRGQWLKSTGIYVLAVVAIFLVSFLIEFVFDFTDKISVVDFNIAGTIAKALFQSVLACLLTFPFTVGIMRVFYNTATGNPVKVQDIFHGFQWDCFWRNSFAILSERAISVFFSILMTIPVTLGVSNFFFEVMLGSDDASLTTLLLHSPSLQVGLFITLFILTFFCIFILPAMTTLYYIITAHREIGVFKTVQMAFSLISCHKAKYWGFYTRFIVWYIPALALGIAPLIFWEAAIPCLAAAAIAALFPTSYMLTATIIFNRELEKDFAERNPEEAAKYMADIQ